ncbi:flagellar basal body P-ring biosynthesis protein [Sphaerisporangium melleum]|uniref:Flagellar basal body P-ring biosynthesis protein n=1 Tax=Sphaerisporangium melleum TaxID=321316 RepID=A0A917RQH2_9ACTN|nr:Flp pilus assembly protein CpaB [Sphaerisporangium melleum]GGL19220.1 flagellar basal body P-ring biosynthesis protein [Sphaerisporangium melleum]GII71162.1 flagellar basal body P-ring biosynthesis protein [Sphaerisporangium melleum]
MRAAHLRAVRLFNRRRRLVAVVLAALATACVGLAVRPAPTVAVLAAARDLHAGPLAPSDLAAVRLPEEAVPDGALRPGARVAGRVLATPARRGEPITDLRMLGPALVDAYGPGLLAAPIRVTDAAAARLLRPGDVIDVIASASPSWDDAPPAAGAAPYPRAATVAQAVTVIALPRAASSDSPEAAMTESGALVVLAATPDQATRLAQAGTTAQLSITIHGNHN